MASKPPGVLGTASNPGYGHSRTSGGLGNSHPPGVSGSSTSTLADLEHRATALAHSISTAIGWQQTRSAAYNLIGHQSFTAGVVVGMGENLAKTVVAAVDLLQTLALAEYWESRQDHSFMARLRSSAFFSIAPGASLGMVVAGHFWPGFDRKAQEAYEERGAIADAIKHAFSHPKEFLGSLTKVQEARAREFIAFLGQQSLSGNFRAGVLMGELLFDLLMVVDLAVGLAKLAMAVPKLARYAEDLARLAREFRVARRLESKTSELVEPGPRITQAQKNANATSGRGSPSTPSRSADPPPTDPPPSNPPAPDEMPDEPAKGDDAPPAFDGKAYLANRREEMGLPAAGSEGDDATLAVVQMNGNTYDGINRGLQDPATEMTLDRVNAQTLTHAEADAVQNAVNDGAAGTQSTAEMWIDREPCKSCGQFGGLRSLARNLQVDQLIVNTPTQQLVILPTK